MVKVELSYNPYLMETKVLFDGRKPRINSRVEKYYHSKLQDWIKEIPEIFYDEMNGYGFELEFSGTKMDFEQIEKTFEDAGIGSDRVVLFHKNEINSRGKCVSLLNEAINWIEHEKNNELFQFDEFKKQFKETLDEDYSFVVINGEELEIDFDSKFNVSVENISKFDEIRDIDLNNTPILVYVDKGMVSYLQNIIAEMTTRHDVNDNQLFFLISSELNKEMVERTIVDLGIKHLQIVDTVYDKRIREYYYAYPVTDHLFRTIKILNDQWSAVQIIVERRRKKCEVSNREIHEEIVVIDSVLETLKKALGKIQSRDNVELPDACAEAQRKLRRNIQNWKKNKYKFSEEYAEKNAIGFSVNLIENYKDFLFTIKKAFIEEKNSYIKHFYRIYKMTGYDDFNVDLSEMVDFKLQPNISISDLKKRLLQKKKVEIVSPKADLREMLFNEGDVSNNLPFNF